MAKVGRDTGQIKCWYKYIISPEDDQGVLIETLSYLTTSSSQNQHYLLSWEIVTLCDHKLCS